MKQIRNSKPRIGRSLSGSARVYTTLGWFAGFLGCYLLAPVSAGADSPAAPPVIELSGTPYELGRAHGEQLSEPARACVRSLLGYFRGYIKVPFVGRWVADWWLSRSWKPARAYIAPEILEELRGLSESSGIAYRDLCLMHAIADRTYSCANFAAWGSMTRDGRLIHVRNLDWNIRAGLQRYATVFVVRPAGKHAFINVGWAGFIGILSGVNDATLSIGQVGAETTDATFGGEPMAFLIRRALEQADGVEQAAEIIQSAHRTVGINYILGHASSRQGLAIETTHRYARIFSADDAAERQVDYARPMRDAVFRADTAIDPVIRECQLASQGNPSSPGLEPPGGSAYRVRYLKQAEGLKEAAGKLDVESAKAIAGSIAPDSNVQSVVFAWPELWVANAQGLTPAAHGVYHSFDAAQLLNGAGKEN